MQAHIYIMRTSSKQIIPFFKSIDKVHCFQSCLKMALVYWFPKKTYTWQELEKMTNHAKDMWTWQGYALLYLAKHGFVVVNIENLDYKLFAKNGPSYLKSIWSKHTYGIQASHSDFHKEQNIARKLVRNKNINAIYKEVQLDDAIHLMKNGYIVLVSVNPYILRGKKGYASHMIVLTKVSKHFVFFHDPGPPGEADKKIQRTVFEKSMSKPAKEDGNIIGIKKL